MAVRNGIEGAGIDGYVLHRGLLLRQLGTFRLSCKKPAPYRRNRFAVQDSLPAASGDRSFLKCSNTTIDPGLSSPESLNSSQQRLPAPGNRAGRER